MIIRALIRSQISQTLSTFTGKTSVKRKKNGQLKKTGTGRKVLFGLLFAYLAIVFIGMFLGMGYGMAVFFLDGSAGGITAYVSIFAMVAFVFCFVGSVFSTEKQLYEAPDNEMLLSMPVAPWAILFSRMISLYFINFVFSGLVLLPGGIMLFIYSKVTAMMVIGFLLALLLIPLLSLALTALIGGLVAFLASKLPFKTLVTTLLFALFFLAYMFFAMNMDVVIQVMAENGAQIASGIPPLNALASLRGQRAERPLFCLMVLGPFLCRLLFAFQIIYYHCHRQSGRAKEKVCCKGDEQELCPGCADQERAGPPFLHAYVCAQQCIGHYIPNRGLCHADRL